ncbi:MAG: diguanylate cyclase [Proteobacteria bacterium]|nr:diguanylate cyclase [Pseudomonadota bacterium]
MDFQRFVHNIPESVVITDVSGTIQFVNPAFTKVTGYSPHEVIGQNPRILKSGRQDPLFYQNMWSAVAKDNHWQGEIWNQRKNGETYPEWLSISAVRNEGGQITNYIGLFTDITFRKLSENTLKYLAYHDSLTGLPNRSLFFDRLNQAIVQADRTKDMISILYIDLDRFKPINDLLGHASGDLLLKKVSQRILKCIRKGDTLARIGGDEFAVILMNIPDFPSIEGIASKILQALSKPFQLQFNQEGLVTASIGIGVYPFDGQKPDGLLHASDQAMYQAKKLGTNRYCFANDIENFPDPRVIGMDSVKGLHK